VDRSQREEWESFVVGEDSIWIEGGMKYQEAIGMLDYTNRSYGAFVSDVDHSKPWPIWWRDDDDVVSVDKGRGPYFPTWQQSPIIHNGMETNENIVKSEHVSRGANASFVTESVVIGEFIYAEPGDFKSKNERTSLFSLLLSTFKNDYAYYEGDPISQVFFPIFDSFEEDRTAVAVMVACKSQG
jgi:hypothetical protein